MIRKLAIALTTALTITPAFAQNAKWGEVGNWQIWGNSQSGTCVSSVPYESGQGITVSFGRSSIDLIVSGVSAVPGKVYQVAFQSTSGERFHLVGVGISDTFVRFPDLTNNTIRVLIRARGISVQGLGRFNLDGSSKAIAEGARCFLALNGSGV